MSDAKKPQFSDDDVCAVCSLRFDEHDGKSHIFTLTPGDLRPHKPKPSAPPPADGLLTSVQAARLLEVLLAKGVLTPLDGAYVMLGGVAVAKPAPDSDSGT